MYNIQYCEYIPSGGRAWWEKGVAATVVNLVVNEPRSPRVGH